MRHGPSPRYFSRGTLANASMIAGLCTTGDETRRSSANHRRASLSSVLVSMKCRLPDCAYDLMLSENRTTAKGPYLRIEGRSGYARCPPQSSPSEGTQTHSEWGWVGQFAEDRIED